MHVKGRIHFVGIGGHGMSAIAKVLLEMGCRVSGSDLSESARTSWLRGLGADVRIGHSGEVVEGAERVVATAAVSEDNPEVLAARRLGIPVFTRAEMLAEMTNPRFGIAVTGTHGKTTTSSMVATILIEGGLDPTVVLGEEVGGVPGGGRFGASNFVVVEADEAYGSFLTLRPKIAVVTNIDDDHLDYYSSPEAIDEAFREFLSHLLEDDLAILSADDPRVMAIASRLGCRRLLYGVSAGELRPDSPVIEGTGYCFDAILRGKKLGRVELSVPGMHNISNALASIGVGVELGIPFEAIRNSLGRFWGARRRLEVIGDVEGVLVMDDYAHHPTEIRATLAALKEAYGRRIIVVFQPQRFTRTKLLFDKFAGAFSSADVAVITEIYHRGTGEEPISGVSGERLAHAIEQHGSVKAVFISEFDDIASWLASNVKPGDLVITMGAGNVNTVAEQLVRRMRDRWKEQN